MVCEATLIPTAINSAMVLNRMTSKLLSFSILKFAFNSLKFVVITFAGAVSVVFIISSHIIAESPIVLPEH